MKKLLWIGDAGCPSGFAKATHGILDTLHSVYDVSVLGINYRGDPHNHPLDPPKYPYPIWAAAPGGDMFGLLRLRWMCDHVKPDVIVLQNDGWNIPPYVKVLQHLEKYSHIPIVAIVAIDGKNFQGAWLNGIDHAIFWTQFALNEAREGGYVGSATVIPLGVDLEVYHPMDRAEVRKKRLPEELHNAFIVGNVNRNQPRKRWDLLVKYFANWITSNDIRDAYLFLHTAPTGDSGHDVKQLAQYYGVVDRLARVTPEVWYGLSEQDMAETYNCFDVNASPSQGEGFGLTALESMACSVPQVLSDWAAYGDWAKRGAWLVPCLMTDIGEPYVNVIGGVADEKKFVQALHRMYIDKRARENNATAALECAQQPQFQWTNIGQRYIEVLNSVFDNQETSPGALVGSSPSESNEEPRSQTISKVGVKGLAPKTARSEGLQNSPASSAGGLL